MRAHAKTEDNFLKNSFVCENLTSLTPYFWLFQSRLSIPYRLVPPRRPDWLAPIVRPCWLVIIIIIIISNLRTTAFKAYCAIWVRRSNFRHQASPRVSPRESTQRRKVELWARNVREFCLNVDLHVTFRDLLHAVKLRHGTDGFTSPPKEGVLKIFRP